MTVTGTVGGLCFAAWAGADQLWAAIRRRAWRAATVLDDDDAVAAGALGLVQPLSASSASPRRSLASPRSRRRCWP